MSDRKLLNQFVEYIPVLTDEIVEQTGHKISIQGLMWNVDETEPMAFAGYGCYDDQKDKWVSFLIDLDCYMTPILKWCNHSSQLNANSNCERLAKEFLM